MYRLLRKNTVTICGAVVLPHVPESLSDSSPSENKNAGWERMKKIFIIDEFGDFSPQLNTILQTTIFTGFFGSFYGGFLGSKEAYLKFIERNQATKFADHFEAKKKLQEAVTLGFGKGALRWGWRLALFGGCYITFVTVFGAYRGSSSLLDFTLAGILSGVIYRFHMGAKAMIASGTVGGMMGMFAGATSFLLFRLTGVSLDDIHRYSADITAHRERQTYEAYKKAKLQGEEDVLKIHETLAVENRKS